MYPWILVGLSACVEERGDGKRGGDAGVEREPAPSLASWPRYMDFERVLPGERVADDVTLTNDGDLSLTVVDDVLPLTLEPGEERVATVVFEPVAAAKHADALVVESDDPAGPRSVLLQGGYSVPVAVCEADPEVVVLESTSFLGHESYDPGGFSIVEYDWTLVSAPEGSTAWMSGSGANRSGFTPDLVGTYVAELVVTNEIGERSEVCVATVEAVPWSGLFLEMYWAHSGDDMDLHLLRPGGELTTDGDCYFENCTWGWLDWGVPELPQDNPWFDLDDVTGTGPELIGLEAPEDGTFTVYVHDYPASEYDGRNEVTLNVWVDYVLVWTEVRNVDEEDAYVPLVDVTFPGGAVTGR